MFYEVKEMIELKKYFTKNFLFAKNLLNLRPSKK